MNRLLAAFVIATIACASEPSRDESASPAHSAQQSAVQLSAETHCYRSSESVLLGPPIGRRNVGHPPGWIRLEGIEKGERGGAELVEANRARLGGQWARLAGDTLRIVAGDDFLRTELRVVLTKDSLVGQADAHSDADLEPDSAGKLGDLRRKWRLTAVRAPCDSVPRR